MESFSVSESEEQLEWTVLPSTGVPVSSAVWSAADVLYVFRAQKTEDS